MGSEATVRLPGTTVLAAPNPDATVGTLAPVEITEPCPASDLAGGGGEGMIEEASRLEPMIGQMLAYGQAHADVFGTYGLIWHDGADASVFAFTRDLDVHRRALGQEVTYPEELIVCQVAINGSEAQALQTQLTRELAGKFFSVVIGASGVAVVLAADQEAVADDLDARFGGAIDLTVGALRYPIETAIDACTDLPAPDVMAGLAIEPEAPDGPIDASGAPAASLTVRLTNTGTSPIRFGSGAAVGVLLDANGNVVNANVGAINGVGTEVDLSPDASLDLSLLVSTASCRPALGYMLPTGDYQLVALVQADTRTLTSEPVAVAVS